jgi:hypothetical protein
MGRLVLVRMLQRSVVRLLKVCRLVNPTKLLAATIRQTAGEIDGAAGRFVVVASRDPSDQHRRNNKPSIYQAHALSSDCGMLLFLFANSTNLFDLQIKAVFLIVIVYRFWQRSDTEQCSLDSESSSLYSLSLDGTP